MIWWQALIQVAVLGILTWLMNNLLRTFKTKKAGFYPLYAILALFSIGFTFRLIENENIVDIGYYLTDISYLFTYIMFTITFMLGQKKYWNVK